MKKVVIIFGTASTEHDVSCHSAEAVLREIDYKKYDVHSIYISKENEWYFFNDNLSQIDIKTWLKSHQQNKIENISETLKQYDVVFPVLHGLYGENGCLQGLLELLHIPYVGCNVQSSAICFDKVWTKELLKNYNIPVVPYYVIYDNSFSIKEIEQKLNYPMIIKPSRGGSSIGIQVAKNKKELIKAIQNAKKYDYKILIEKFIKARELECAVLEEKNISTSTIGEIFSANSFYDYEAKYENNQTYTVIDCDLSQDVKNKIKNYAKKAFQFLECSGLSRIDFFYDETNNQIYFNEINTLPGFTEISMYPKLIMATGISYQKLISKLIDYAIKNRKM